MSDQGESISEVVPGIFRIVIPIPIPEVGSVNSYVIVDNDRNLIIDPGMAHPASCEIMEKAIEVLGLDLGRTDFFITHHHLDHFGSVSKFLSGTSFIYISRPEAEFIDRIASGEAEAETGVFLEMLGFPEKDPMKVVSQFYGNEFRQRRPWPFRHVADGDILERGGLRFTCLVAPGHSIGHTCLYEAVRRVLIAGDQITAGIQFLLDRANPLASHVQSLGRLSELDVNLTLPGHGSPIKDHRKRIDFMRAHHQGRSTAACAALREDGEEGKDAYEVTLALDGRLPDRDPINTLPLVMRFIHTRHTFAYLQHLAAQGYARKENRQGRVLFFPCQPTDSTADFHGFDSSSCQGRRANSSRANNDGNCDR
jgi:glyoxylase-like metal-dependent hydrolase (beta-lactamase superfamily II)